MVIWKKAIEKLAKKKKNTFEDMNNAYKRKKETKEKLTYINTQLSNDNARNKDLKNKIKELKTSAEDKTVMLEALKEQLESLKTECSQIANQLEKKD